MEVTSEKQPVPKLRFPEFTRAWEKHKLGEYYTFKNGVNADKSMYGHGRKFINVLDIIADGPITSGKIIGSVSISDAAFESYKVVYGDVLFQRSSETREEVGQSNVYLDKDIPATFGGFVIRGHPIKEIDPEYVDSLLKTAKVRKDMTARSGGSTRYNVGQESLSQVTIHVAPTAQEQEKIAAFLGAVDKKIEKLECKKKQLEAYKKACMQKIFSRELRFKDDQGRDFPDWEDTTLGTLVDISTGASNREDSGEKGAYTFFDRSADIRRSDKYIFDCEALIVAGEGKDFPPRYFKGKFDLHQRAYAITEFGKNSARYLFHWIDWHRHNFLKRSVGSTMPSLRMNSFTDFPVKLPLPEEQRKIGGFLSAIDTKIRLVVTEIEQAQSFKKALLQQMFV